MNRLKKKSLVLSIIFGLEFVLISLIPVYFKFLFILVFATTLIAWFYNFEIRNQKKEWLFHNLRFLILPMLFNLGAALYLATFFQETTKIILSVIIAVINYLLFIALRRVHNLGEKAAIFQRNVIISVAFLSVYLSLSAIFRSYVSLSVADDYKMPQSIVVLATVLIFYGVSHFLAWENGLNMKKFMPYNMVTAIIGGEIAWIASIWIINYPVFGTSEQASLGGSPLPAVILTIVFYLFWGIISHKADRSLTKKVMSEYLIISALFLFILVLTAKWLAEI